MEKYDYKAIDYVGMYAESVKDEDTYSQVDDMLRAAAVLTVKAEEMLDESLPKEDE